jgi:hypothetical protein
MSCLQFNSVLKSFKLLLGIENGFVSQFIHIHFKLELLDHPSTAIFRNTPLTTKCVRLEGNIQ